MRKTDCEAHTNVQTGYYCPVCLLEERDQLRAELDALKAQQPSIGDVLREKLEGMRFDLSLLAASDACFNELEAKCEAFDEAISIADSMSWVTAQPIEGEDKN